MARDELIEAYLAELDRELTLPRRLRRRALAEASDHLACAADAYEARAGGAPARTKDEPRAGEGGGEADSGRLATGIRPTPRITPSTPRSPSPPPSPSSPPFAPPRPSEAAQRAAITAFGPARVVARRFADELAVSSAKRAAGAVAVAVLAYCALFYLSTQVPPLRDASPFSDGLSGAIAWLMVQIALTGGALTVVRAIRHRADSAIPAGKLRYMHRSAGVALGAVAASVLADLVAAIVVTPADSSSSRAYLVAGAAVVGLATLAAALRLARAHARMRALATIADEPAPPGEDALDDLLTLAAPLVDRARTLPLAAPAVQRAQRVAAGPRARSLVERLDLRTHPWRFCLAVALSAGGSLAAAQLVGEGAPTEGLLAALAVVTVLVAIEGAAVVLSFAVLGRFLGIRRPPPGAPGP